MSVCIPLRFGVGNHVRDSIITAYPAPVAETPLGWLKTERRAQSTHWPQVSQDIVIKGTLSDLRVADVLAIPNSTLVGADEVRLDLFENADYTTRVHTTGFNRLGEPPAVGVNWRAGLDGFGVTNDDENPSVFVTWMPQPVIFQSWRLVIKLSDYTSAQVPVALRMLVIASKVQMQNNFVYGAQISFHGDPDLVQVESGGYHEATPQIESRRLSLSLPLMTSVDRRALRLMRKRLAGQPFVVSAYSGEPMDWEVSDHAFLGRFASPDGYSHSHPGLYESNLVIVEA